MFSDGLHLSVDGEQGFITTELLKIGTVGLALGRVVSTGHEIELSDAENLTFLLPRAGRLDIRMGGHDYSLSSGCLMALRPGARRTRASAGAAGTFAAATLQVRFDRMRELAEEAHVSLERVFARDGVALGGEAGLLASSLPRLVDDVFSCPDQPVPPKVASAIGQLVEDQLCEVMEITCAEARSQRILPAFHRVRQAEEMMRSLSGEALSMLEVARACGVSLRSLQLAFKEVHDGLSPRDILIRIRLERARRLLLSESQDVTTVAMECGFLHLGRFARAYKTAYGERPSETLLRRRAAGMG
jgi:AraC-like DNA-binding protein